MNGQAQAARIQSIMRSRGYRAVIRPRGRGRAINIMKFSSPSCPNVRIMPISTLLQEASLLSSARGSSDNQIFIYYDRAWTGATPDGIALSHLSQQFLQLIRVRPDPAIDTMLYVISPKKCGPFQTDWTQFWVRVPVSGIGAGFLTSP